MALTVQPFLPKWLKASSNRVRSNFPSKYLSLGVSSLYSRRDAEGPSAATKAVPASAELIGLGRGLGLKRYPNVGRQRPMRRVQPLDLD